MEMEDFYFLIFLMLLCRKRHIMQISWRRDLVDSLKSRGEPDGCILVNRQGKCFLGF